MCRSCTAMARREAFLDEVVGSGRVWMLVGWCVPVCGCAGVWVCRLRNMCAVRVVVVA